MSDINVPEGWLSIKLGDVIDYGKCEKATPNEILDNTWVLELEDIEKNSSKILQRLTFADRKSKSTKNKFNENDVLYGKLRPYLNKVVIADGDGVCTTEIIPIRGTKYLSYKFLFYSFKNPFFLNYVTHVCYGVNMPRLGTKDGKNSPFFLPSLPEQQQITKRLDHHLDMVEVGSSNLPIPTK